MRRPGKSLIKDRALDAGLRIMVCTPASTTIQRRKKHLTLTEIYQRPEPKYKVVYDECPRD